MVHFNETYWKSSEYNNVCSVSQDTNSYLLVISKETSTKCELFSPLNWRQNYYSEKFIHCNNVGIHKLCHMIEGFNYSWNYYYSYSYLIELKSKVVPASCSRMLQKYFSTKWSFFFFRTWAGIPFQTFPEYPSVAQSMRIATKLFKTLLPKQFVMTKYHFCVCIRLADLNNNNNNNNNNNGLFTVYPHKRMWLFICEGLQY